MGVLTFLYECATVLRSAELRRTAGRRLAVLAGKYLLFPLAVHLLAQRLGRHADADGGADRADLADRDPDRPDAVSPAYQPLAEASTLVLLIVSVGVHFAMVGLGR